MALKGGTDHAKMWKDFVNFYFLVITSGLLYLILLVTSEPVCYTRVSLGERNTYMKKVDCDGTDKICHRFASSEDVNLGVVFSITCSTTNLPTITDGFFDCALNSEVSMGEACALSCCGGFYAAYSNQVVCEAGTTNQEGKWSKGSFVCRAITCQETHLPIVNAGFFNCSGYSVGDTCILTCDDDYYPSATKYTICEGYDNRKANWTVGRFQCSEITCYTNNLPIVGEGSFDCAPNTDISKGGACNLTCNNGFYPAYSKQVVCEEEITNQGGVWSNGSFVCRKIKCSTNNLPNVLEGSFDCAPNTDIAKGGVCTLICNQGFYSAYSKQAVCEEEITNQGGVWSNGSFVCHEITCSTNNLPIVAEGYFGCDPNTAIAKGEACNLTCNRGFYPAYSKQAVCEEEITNQGGVWSNGSFVCHEITCSTNKLPNVGGGSFDCYPDTDISKGDVCTLTCNKGFYPAYSSQAVCEEKRTNQGGVWSDGILVCHECNEWNEWNGSDYKFINEWQTWEVSLQSCESDNSHLVTTDNKEENEFVGKMVSYCHQPHPTIWIGLNDRSTEGTWEWSNGAVSTYRSWDEGKPDGGEARDCVVIRTNGKWYDWSCYEKREVVCERNNPPT